MLIRDLWGLGFGGRERHSLGQVGNQRKYPEGLAWEEGTSTCLVAVSMHLSHWPCSTYRSKAATTSTPTSYGPVKKTELHEGRRGKESLSLPVLASCCLCQSHRVHFALALEELFITLVHIVFIPVKARRKLTHQSARSTPVP